MTADLTLSEPSSAMVRRLRLQAFASSMMVTIGAGLAAVAVVAAVVVSLPLMLAASVTLRPSGNRRRGWQELEPVEA